MTGTVRLEHNDGIATMVFDNRRRRNAMSLAMWEQIPPLCAQLDEDLDLRAVLLTGAGDEAFVAGADISEFDEQRTPDRAPHYDETTASAQQCLRELGVPVVAKIKGFCIGGGLALALSADLRFCGHSATFGLPPARLGIGYSAEGVGALVDVVGPGPAAEILFAAEWFEAQKAQRWGLVNEVVGDDMLDDFVDSWLETAASRAPLSQRAAKQAIRAHLATGDRQAELKSQAEKLIARCYNSADYQEGVAAFGQRRLPRFVGR